MKKLLSLLAIFTLLFAVAGCSSNEDEGKEEKAAEEKTAELNDAAKSKIYNSVRIAELKVNEVFNKETAADEETIVINSSFADESSASAFLSKYYSEDLAKEMYAHYATDQKSEDGKMIVNTEPFFNPSFLDTTQEDVKIEGNADKATVTTAENAAYTVEMQDENYVITGYEK
ncbi:endonuclease [Bacillus infantis]|uniref:endonuclease n=1 Tax=Bacillus infantis TaxID=324767 RepID=UPI003982C6B7